MLLAVQTASGKANEGSRAEDAVPCTEAPKNKCKRKNNYTVPECRRRDYRFLVVQTKSVGSATPWTERSACPHDTRLKLAASGYLEGWFRDPYDPCYRAEILSSIADNGEFDSP